MVATKTVTTLSVMALLAPLALANDSEPIPDITCTPVDYQHEVGVAIPDDHDDKSEHIVGVNDDPWAWFVIAWDGNLEDCQGGSVPDADFDCEYESGLGGARFDQWGWYDDDGDGRVDKDECQLVGGHHSLTGGFKPVIGVGAFRTGIDTDSTDPTFSCDGIISPSTNSALGTSDWLSPISLAHPAAYTYTVPAPSWGCDTALWLFVFPWVTIEPPAVAFSTLGHAKTA